MPFNSKSVQSCLEPQRRFQPVSKLTKTANVIGINRLKCQTDKVDIGIRTKKKTKIPKNSIQAEKMSVFYSTFLTLPPPAPPLIPWPLCSFPQNWLILHFWFATPGFKSDWKKCCLFVFFSFSSWNFVLFRSKKCFSTKFRNSNLCSIGFFNSVRNGPKSNEVWPIFEFGQISE